MGRPLTLLLAVGWLSACGALRNGPQQRVSITTVPPGATVAVDGQRVAQPHRVFLDRDRDHHITAQMNGFQPVGTVIRHESDTPVVVGNCLFFLCVPLLWEHGAPSTYRLVPTKVELMLNPEGWTPR